MEARRFPPKLLDDFARARETHEWTISGPDTNIELCDDLDESDALAGLLPFGTDGGGGIWYCDVDNRLGGGAGSIVYLHMGSAYGDARLVARSYSDLLDQVAGGLDPFELPTLDDRASAASARYVSVAGIEAVVEVKRVHARTGGPAEVVCERDVLAGGLPARGGESIHLTDEGRVHFLTLAARTIVDGIPCATGTPLALHPSTGRPLRFTPDGPLEIDDLPLRGGHEITVYDPIYSAGMSGVLDRDHDVGGVPLAAGTRVSLIGESRALASGTLRSAATLGGRRLEAGTWFELLGETLYRTRPSGE